MVLPTPDMSSCKKKLRCLTGVNEGKAYDPEDPCPGYGPFDPVKCDCQSMLGTWRFDGFVSGGGAQLRAITSGNYTITVEGTKIGLAFSSIAGGTRVEVGPRVAEMENLNSTAYQTVLTCEGVNGGVGSTWTFGVATPTGGLNTYLMTCIPVGLCPVPACPADEGATYTVTGSWTKVA